MTIAAVVLAAGQSSRFGSNKLLIDIDGQPLMQRLLEEIAASNIDETLVVAPNADCDVTNAVGSGQTSCSVVVNPASAAGLSSSIRCGIEALRPGTSAAMIVLADMPGVTAGLIDTIIAAFRDDGKRRITMPVRSDGRRGHPVLWPASYFDTLRQLNGDSGGRRIIEAAQNDVLGVPCEDRGAFLDIDTPQDLRDFVTKPIT